MLSRLSLSLPPDSHQHQSDTSVFLPDTLSALILIGRGSGEVLAWAGNALALLGRDPLGCLATEVIPWPLLSPLQAPVAENRPLPYWRRFRHEGHLLDATLTADERHLFVLLEPVSESPTLDDPLSLLWPLTQALHRAPSLATLARATLDAVAALSGYDRVRLVRLKLDGSSTMILETGPPGPDALPFPPELFPGRSRLLYLPDGVGTPRCFHPACFDHVDVSSATAPAGFCLSRKPETGALLALPLLEGDAVWGLVIAEHPTPRPLPAPVRQSLGIVTEHWGGGPERTLASQQRARITRALATTETLEQLAGGIAHEMNNLLQPISGYAELGLMITESTSETHDFLTEIQTAATHAAEFVRQVARYARRYRPVTTTLAIGPTLHTALASLRRTLPALEIDLAMDLDNIGPVVADTEGLEDLLGILLRNAWEAQGGQGCVHVCVQAAPPLDPAPLCQNAGAGVPAVDLIVQDHGTGMPPEVAANAFSPFYSTRGAGEGRGLGLAIAQGIVEGWCGQIFLTTGVGRGTEVRVRLPQIGPEWHRETPGACPLGRREACLRQGVRLKALGESEPNNKPGEADLLYRPETCLTGVRRHD